MKLAGALGVMVVLVLAGCSPRGTSQAPKQPGDLHASTDSHDESLAMDHELAHTLGPGRTDVVVTMNDELYHAIGTTTLTSDVIELPSERLSLAQWEEDDEDEPVAIQTWGVPQEREDPGAKP